MINYDTSEKQKRGVRCLVAHWQVELAQLRSNMTHHVSDALDL